MHNFGALNSGHFDVLVIGGGVTGAGVALDAVARGYNVALVEKADFASGTSSKSTKLVHGGIRYLPNFDFALVHEALVERGILLHNAPFLVQPIPFILPIYEGDRHPVGMPISTPKNIGISQMLNMGLWLYDTMAGRRNMQRHRHLKRDTVLKLAPALVTEGLKEGFMYYDAQTHDARLTMALIRTAAQYGATIVNYAAVTSFLMREGRIFGAVVRDQLNNQETTVQARHIINATGIYAEQVEALTGYEPQVRIEPSKGVHLVFSRQDLKLGDAAIVLPETEDRRILFIVPWASRAIFGTTDTGSGDLDHPTATPEDIAYLLKYLNRYLSTHLTEADIISTYVGYRPLLKQHQTDVSTAKLSRTHAVLQSSSGLITIVGGKLTTYRRMAQDTVDVLSARDGSPPSHPTQSLPLQGSAGWPLAKQILESRGTALGLQPATIQHLGRSYGSGTNVLLDLVEGDASLATLLIDDLPYIKAEVIYASAYEMAMTPHDVLARRTSIAVEDRQRGLGIVENVAEMMGKVHNWSPAQRRLMSTAYHDTIQEQIAAEKGTQFKLQSMQQDIPRLEI